MIEALGIAGIVVAVLGAIIFLIFLSILGKGMSR